MGEHNEPRPFTGTNAANPNEDRQDRPQTVRLKRERKVTPTGLTKPELVDRRPGVQKTERSQEVEPKSSQEVARKRKRVPLESEFKRITNYIHVDRLQRIRELQARDDLGSLTRVIDATLTEYLERHFPK